MIRTQIQLTEDQARRLKRAAAGRGVSVAHLIRDAVDRALEENDRDARWDRALAVVGKFHGDSANVSEDHDRYLADAFDE
jgi:Arc/MetJ-type ribon-helix-helix transcriptional regulator